MKAPQNTPVPPQPVHYDESLVARCFPYRFRKIGTPYAYLNDIGIHAIVEFISKGHLLIDVAEAVNVPLMTLRQWVEQEGHLQAIEEAESLSAEGYLAEGMKRLRSAQTEFELRRAKEMIKHAQYMAGKKNKPIYGEAVNAKPSSPVTYIFNVPGMPEATAMAGRVIDSTANRIDAPTAADEVPRVSVDLGSLYGIPTDSNNVLEPITDNMLGHLAAEKISDGPELVLVADRPAKPTPQNPDIGPFFEEVG